MIKNWEQVNCRYSYLDSRCLETRSCVHIKLSRACAVATPCGRAILLLERQRGEGLSWVFYGVHRSINLEQYDYEMTELKV